MIRIILLSIAGWLVASSVFTACGGSAKRSHDLLYDVRGYNEGVRWVKLSQAAVRIPPAERDAFLDEREQLEDDLRIDDYEITRLKMPGKGQEDANVQVKWTWHMDGEGIVRTTTSKQKWRRYGKRWLMLSEARVRGAQMPGVPDKPPSKDESESSDDAAPSESGDDNPEQEEASDSRESASLRSRRETNRTSE